MGRQVQRGLIMLEQPTQKPVKPLDLETLDHRKQTEGRWEVGGRDGVTG